MGDGCRWRHGDIAKPGAYKTMFSRHVFAATASERSLEPIALGTPTTFRNDDYIWVVLANGVKCHVRRRLLTAFPAGSITTNIVPRRRQ